MVNNTLSFSYVNVLDDLLELSQAYGNRLVPFPDLHTIRMVGEHLQEQPVLWIEHHLAAGHVECA